MDGETILQRSEQATFQVIDGETILIQMDTGAYFSLNRVGTEYWEMLDGETSIAEHAASIAANYEVELNMVVVDLLDLSQKMAKEQLATVVS